MPATANMPNAQAILDKLKDVQSPHAISMWPETIAWYIVFALAFVVLAWLVIRFLRSFFRKRRQKYALILLHDAAGKYAENSSLAIAEISTLLRRIALAKFKRENVAGLKNTAWLKFLDHQLHTHEFSTGIGQILITAPYQKNVDIDISALSNLVERWIKRVL